MRSLAFPYRVFPTSDYTSPQRKAARPFSFNKVRAQSTRDIKTNCQRTRARAEIFAIAELERLDLKIASASISCCGVTAKLFQEAIRRHPSEAKRFHNADQSESSVADLTFTAAFATPDGRHQLRLIDIHIDKRRIDDIAFSLSLCLSCRPSIRLARNSMNIVRFKVSASGIPRAATLRCSKQIRSREARDGWGNGEANLTLRHQFARITQQLSDNNVEVNFHLFLLPLSLSLSLAHFFPRVI